MSDYVRKISATQINLYNKCPFAYYLRYKRKIKNPPTPALIKGSIIHSVLDKFFDLNPKKEGFNRYNYETKFQEHILNVFDTVLVEKRKSFGKEVPTYKEEFHSICENNIEYAKEISDCKKILRNFVIYYCMQLEQFVDKYNNVPQAFYMTKPKFRELDLSAENIYAIADCIPKYSSELAIDDYKSSTCYGDGFSDEHELQLKIYCYLYYLKFDELPLLGRIIYLRYGVRCQYRFDKSIIDECKQLIDNFIEMTEYEDMQYYPLNIKDKFCTCSLSEHPDGKGFKSGYKCDNQEYCDKAIKDGVAVIKTE